jgi:hypothetical protein
LSAVSHTDYESAISIIWYRLVNQIKLKSVLIREEKMLLMNGVINNTGIFFLYANSIK